MTFCQLISLSIKVLHAFKLIQKFVYSMTTFPAYIKIQVSKQFLSLTNGLLYDLCIGYLTDQSEHSKQCASLACVQI